MYLLKQKGLNNNACAQQRTELYANKKLSVGVTATTETENNFRNFQKMSTLKFNFSK